MQRSSEGSEPEIPRRRSWSFSLKKRGGDAVPREERRASSAEITQWLDDLPPYSLAMAQGASEREEEVDSVVRIMVEGELYQEQTVARRADGTLLLVDQLKLLEQQIHASRGSIESSGSSTVTRSDDIPVVVCPTTPDANCASSSPHAKPHSRQCFRFKKKTRKGLRSKKEVRQK